MKNTYYLLLNGEHWWTGINTLEAARQKAIELGGDIEIFEHVEYIPSTSEAERMRQLGAVELPGMEAAKE